MSEAAGNTSDGRAGVRDHIFHPRVLSGLGAIAALLIAASLAAELYQHVLGGGGLNGLAIELTADWEGNPATWFSSTLLLGCAALCAIVARAGAATGGAHPGAWTILAVAFLLMSLDEVGQFHEELIDPLRALFDAGGIFYYSWIIAAIPAVVGLGLLISRVARPMNVRVRRVLLLGAAIYFFGAVGMEAIGGAHREASGDGLIFGLMTTLEEGLEMTGSLLIINALIGYLRTSFDGISLDLSTARIEASEPEPEQELALDAEPVH